MLALKKRICCGGKKQDEESEPLNKNQVEEIDEVD